MLQTPVNGSEGKGVTVRNKVSRHEEIRGRGDEATLYSRI